MSQDILKLEYITASICKQACTGMSEVMKTEVFDTCSTAGIIERTGQVKNHDNRVFQDGIFIIEKAGKKI